MESFRCPYSEDIAFSFKSCVGKVTLPSLKTLAYSSPCCRAQLSQVFAFWRMLPTSLLYSQLGISSVDGGEELPDILHGLFMKIGNNIQGCSIS